MERKGGRVSGHQTPSPLGSRIPTASVSLFAKGTLPFVSVQSKPLTPPPLPLLQALATALVAFLPLACLSPGPNPFGLRFPNLGMGDASQYLSYRVVAHKCLVWDELRRVSAGDSAEDVCGLESWLCPADGSRPGVRVGDTARPQGARAVPSPVRTAGRAGGPGWAGQGRGRAGIQMFGSARHSRA
jgi:hypothetical protein